MTAEDIFNATVRDLDEADLVRDDGVELVSLMEAGALHNHDDNEASTSRSHDSDPTSIASVTYSSDASSDESEESTPAAHQKRLRKTSSVIFAPFWSVYCSIKRG